MIVDVNEWPLDKQMGFYRAIVKMLAWRSGGVLDFHLRELEDLPPGLAVSASPDGEITLLTTQGTKDQLYEYALRLLLNREDPPESGPKQ